MMPPTWTNSQRLRFGTKSLYASPDDPEDDLKIISPFVPFFSVPQSTAVSTLGSRSLLYDNTVGHMRTESIDS